MPGATSWQPFAFYDPAWSSWRTWQPCATPDAAWEPFSGTWPPQGMTRHGAAFGPPTSGPRIRGRACSSPLLPTPQARDHHGAQLPEVRRAAGHQVNLNDAAVGLAVNWDRDGWGRYQPAIRCWEQILGRTAPFPAEPGRRGRCRLSPDFAEWLMGLPAGWVTGVPGLPYSAEIRALGNGVVPLQAATALRLLAAITADVASAWSDRPGIGLEDYRAA
jgi:hypothetical protein